jgi:hypothetical protein
MHDEVDDQVKRFELIFLALAQFAALTMEQGTSKLVTPFPRLS